MAEQPEVNKQWSKLTADASADEKLKQRLQEQPLSVLKEYGIPVQDGIEAKELGEGELAHVTGGMKWTRNTKNSDVVDARGGQIKFLGLTISFDKDGKVSDVS